MTTTELHLVQTSAEQSLGGYDIKTAMTTEILGEPATFAVIGSSHYITAPNLQFHELLSCRQIDGVDEQTIPLTVGERVTVTSEHAVVTTDTVIDAQPLQEFPGPTDADVVYRFGKQAYTTITVRAASTYETYHTYPEYDVALYSQTTLTPTPGVQSMTSADARSRREATPVNLQ